MQRRWTSLKENYTSFLAGSVNAVQNIGGGIKQIWQSDSLRASAKTFSLQSLTGISISSFFSSIPISIQYEKARLPLWGQMPDGITSYSGFVFDNTMLITLQVMLTERISQGLHTLPGVEGTYLEYGAYAFDAAAYLYMLRQKRTSSTNKIFYQMAIAKAVTPDAEVLKDQGAHHRMFKPCGKECGETASIMADVMKIPESIADTLFCYSVANACSLLLFNLKDPLPYVNEIVLYPLLSLKYGRDFLNAKLSSVGMCETHRNEIITANNARCMAKGATMLFGVYGVPWVLDKLGYTWAAAILNNDFISTGLFTFSYMNFMASELQITNTLPGTEPGIDIFKYVHIATQESTKWLVSKVVSACWDTKSNVTWNQQLTNLENAYKAPVAQLVMTVLVGRDSSSLKAFLKRPAVHSFVTVYESSLKENVEWLNDLRFRGVARTILKVLPERVLDPTTKNILITWGSKEMDGPAKSLAELIERVYPGRFPAVKPKQPELLSRESVHEMANTEQPMLIAKPEKEILPVKDEESKETSGEHVERIVEVPNLAFLGRRQALPPVTSGDNATKNFAEAMAGFAKKNK